MERQTTEGLENSAMPVTDTQTIETSGQSTVRPVANEQTTETSEQNAPAIEASELSSLPPVANEQATEPLEHSSLPPVMNTQTTETLEQSTAPSEITDNSHEDVVPSHENHEGMEIRPETAEEAEVRSILKVIAATGKFWHDWEKLRSMLSTHLKQVLSDYPQEKMTVEGQKLSLGETHAELVIRLDDALHSFVEGPPFTLQRLSEIILDAQSLYPNLSKLALALEKNLSVTSTLTISTNPCKPYGLEKVVEDPNPQQQSDSDLVVENGSESDPTATDRDEIMTEFKADVGDVMTMDMETDERPLESSRVTGNS